SRPWTAGVFFWTGFDYRGEPYPKAWPNTGSLFGLMDYCGYPKEEMWELRGLWSGESKRQLKAARKAEEPKLKAGQVIMKPHKTELKRDGQDVIVIDVFSNEPSLKVSVSGAEFLGWGNGDPQFRHQERNCDTIYPFVGRAQVLIRSIENNEGPVTVRVGASELVF
ncbi:MAG: hypothetical protein J6037_04880, partial [Bacteroidales bacterium]|nr:hypothetical protein [Bacteroidales bacterium]